MKNENEQAYFNIFTKMYDNFAYLNLSKSECLEEIMKNITKNISVKEFETFTREYFISKSSILINENEDTAKMILSNYLIMKYASPANLANKKNNLLTKFSSFLNACNYNITPEVIIYLLDNNEIFKKSVTDYFNKHKTEILSGRYDYENDFYIRNIINIYTSRLDIKVQEEEIKDDNLSDLDNSIKLYLEEISKYPLLSEEEEFLITKRIKNDDKEALKILVESNLKLVVYIARRFFSKYNLPLLDLIQEGNVGLIIAAEKYDYRENIKFSSYASWWIKEKMYRAVASSTRNIRIPDYLFYEIGKYKWVINNAKITQGKELTDEEVAKIMDISLDRLNLIKSKLNDTSSLDVNVFDDDDVTLIDNIEDDVSCEELYEKKEKIELIRQMLDRCNLSEQGRKVILLRFGFYNNRKYTLQEIGDMFNISRERVRQIEKQALRKLSHSVTAKSLVDYAQNIESAKSITNRW